MSLIEVNDLTKEFKVYTRQKGILNTLKTFFHRPFEIKKAVDEVSFNIKKGEIVGYIGPNGAGKSTTIKMLSGILVPSRGQLEVDGIIPHKNRIENALKIGVVFGQRTHLHWDIPVIDSYELYKKMYKISDTKYTKNIKFFTDLLGLGEFINKPVRQLSLGQKMRAEIAGALLHEPSILYLDEPTIGLDVVAKSRMRDFIKQVNKELKTTVVITTHNMDDIEALCERLIMIDRGKILYDGSLLKFKEKYGGDHLLIVKFDAEDIKIEDPRLHLRKNEGKLKHIVFNQKDLNIAEAVTYISRNFNIKDLSVNEPDIEGIVKRFYLQSDKST